MAVGVETFQGERLSQAREARGITATALASLIDVTPATISQYEHGQHKPRQVVLDRIAKQLNFPNSFFERPSKRSVSGSRVFYRSMSAATKAARNSAQRRYELLLEVVDYLTEYFDLPDVNIPDLDIPEDFRSISDLQIESLADQVRQHWFLGEGPIGDMVRTLEANGVLVWRTILGANTLDAFSESDNGRPFVVLGDDKHNYFRSRFDAAHELGHLILHRNIDRKSIKKSHEFRLIEKQAHRFAAAFLLPATAFTKELWGFSIDAFRALKPRWNVSIALMINRCSDLGLVTDEQTKRLWINLSRRGYRKMEPLDDSVPVERPKMLSKCFRMLVDERVKSPNDLKSDLHLSLTDIEDIAGMEAGELGGYVNEPGGEPKLKVSSGKVVQFRR